MNEVGKAGEGWTKTVCQCAGTISERFRSLCSTKSKAEGHQTNAQAV